MIKYLRDKITGRSASFSPIDDLSLDDNIPPIKKTHSQNSLNDVMSITTNLNSNDIISNDRTTSQIEKLNAGGGGGMNLERRSNCSSSSPIIIPKKPPRSNTSSQSPSSYTSIADQMSSLGETSLKSHRDLDDTSNTLLPMLSSSCQQLEHSAARDRISVKNKRRQPIKQKLSTLRETDDNQNNLFSSTFDDKYAIISSQIEIKQQQQPIVDSSDFDTIREHLRVSIRPRDHSADNILSTTPFISSVQRSISCKRPQELNEKKLSNRLIFKKDEHENKNQSTKEHIYDNLDLFKHHQINSTSNIVSTREYSTRLRPVTMHISTNNDKQTINEFENVFNQFKKHTSIKKDQSKEEIITLEESTQPSPVEISTYLSNENELVVPDVISTNKIIETSSVSQTFNRRKTVGGIHLHANNKVAADDNKPTPSWIDIAKQKQNKFHPVSNEQLHHEESEQQQKTSSSIEPTLVSRKQVIISYNVPTVKDNTSDDIRSNRKSMYESVFTRRPSPPITSTNTHIIERDSIRALKAGNPNRINNLIQFFDK